MSWSSNVQSADLDAIIRFPEPAFQPESAKESREQFEEAVESVVNIISSGVMGDHKLYNVTIGGHANVGHEPASGWANDSLTISIQQV